MAKVGDFDFYCEEVISDKTPVKKLFESDEVLAFYHTKPAYKTHIVIVPKVHIHDLLALDESSRELILEIIETARKIASTLNLDDGIRLLTNMGKFQDTPHLHFHLVSGDKI